MTYKRVSLMSRLNGMEEVNIAARFFVSIFFSLFYFKTSPYCKKCPTELQLIQYSKPSFHFYWIYMAI